MKYGESFFDILYLVFAIAGGFLLLGKARNSTEKKMGIAALVLGFGDAFHLVPRVLNYFTEANLTAALGIGKLVTSVTMTLFYVLLYYIWREYYGEKENRQTELAVWILAAVRILLCLFPQNGWTANSGSLAWAVIRNVPFTALGVLILWLFWKNRAKDRLFGRFWLLILLSFLFYLPVAVAAGLLPILGMLMLPKTVCYILMILTFLKASKE